MLNFFDKTQQLYYTYLENLKGENNMANSTSTKKKSSSSSASNSSTSRRSGGWGINKISFYTICAVAILYLVSAVLGACGVSLKVISALQGFATAILIIITSILAWRYVSKKPTVWKVLFLICLLVVILGIIIPLVV